MKIAVAFGFSKLSGLYIARFVLVRSQRESPLVPCSLASAEAQYRSEVLRVFSTLHQSTRFLIY